MLQIGIEKSLKQSIKAAKFQPKLPNVAGFTKKLALTWHATIPIIAIALKKS